MQRHNTRSLSRKFPNSALLASIDEIIEVLGVDIGPDGKERLAFDLAFAEETYAVWSGATRTKTPAAEIACRLRKIEKAATTLREAIGDSPDYLPPIVEILMEPLNPKTRAAGFPVHEAVSGFRHQLPILERAAREARIRLDARRPKGRGGGRHYGNVALQNLVGDLIAAYEEATRRTAGVSTDPHSGQRGGPLIRYLGLCLKLLDIEMNEESIRGYIFRHRTNQSRSAD